MTSTGNPGSRRTFFIGVLTLLLTIGLAFAPIPWARLGAGGYVGLFVASLASGAVAFVPSPAQGLIISASRTLPVFPVALIAGIGWSIGELTTYFAGRNLPRDMGPLLNFLMKPAEWIIRHHKASYILIYLVCVAPLPLFDAVSIAAGQHGVSFRRYFAPVVLARFTRALALAYWGAHLGRR